MKRLGVLVKYHTKAVLAGVTRERPGGPTTKTAAEALKDTKIGSLWVEVTLLKKRILARFFPISGRPGTFAVFFRCLLLLFRSSLSALPASKFSRGVTETARIS